MSRLQFKLEAVASGSRARATTFQTLHNVVKTPVFMPVATVAAVRGHHFDLLRQTGSQVLLANTYHLLLRPGIEVFQRLGGIHKFMNWDRSVLTDSGGFQIFSLPHARHMEEKGARFQSYVDGRWFLLSPETSIEMQKAIGSDIMMVLDQCVPGTVDFNVAQQAMELTHRWAARSLQARGDSSQSLFAIVQGACHSELRRQSADVLTQMPFDGFAIGGLAVGEPKSQREDMTELAASLLPSHFPRYLMGVGTPLDLLEAVHRGVDMFDCIIPTALAQQGVCFTWQGRIDLRRGRYKFAEDPIDKNCLCPTCTSYSRAYLYHLIRTKEVLGWQLVGAHNLHFYHSLMAQMRECILNDTFAAFYREARTSLGQNDGREALGDYEIVASRHGTFYSIRQKSSGEVMHSVTSPFEEAQKLYVEQSQLRERVRIQDSEPLVIWDVGLGAATNAMAVLHCVEAVALQGQQGRAVELVSFERDLNPLKLVLKHPQCFSYLKLQVVKEFLKTGQWISADGRFKWMLKTGDFFETLTDALVPELIFYDPFSFKTDTELWTLSCFEKIYNHCAGRPATLFTYSSSTAVRATLLSAGFYVARGLGTGPKTETTIAMTAAAFEAGSQYALLNDQWLSKWEKSQAPGPLLDSTQKQMPPELVQQKLRGHSQFFLKNPTIM